MKTAHSKDLRRDPFMDTARHACSPFLKANAKCSSSVVFEHHAKETRRGETFNVLHGVSDGAAAAMLQPAAGEDTGSTLLSVLLVRRWLGLTQLIYMLAALGSTA